MSASKKALLQQLVPIHDLANFTWAEYQKLARSREAELAPSFPAFLVFANVNELSDTSLGSRKEEKEEEKDKEKEEEKKEAKEHELQQKRRRGFVPKTVEQVCQEISPMQISTQTKIVMLSADVDVDALFWRLPLIRYEEPRAGILKKQIQVQATTPEEVQAYVDKRATLRRFFTEVVTVDTKNLNVYARENKYIERRIPFVGIISKDMVSAKSKVKLTFIHCTTLNVRAWNASQARWNEVHLKIFKTGKIIIPGITDCAADMFLHVLSLVMQLMNDALQEIYPGSPLIYIRHDLTACSGNHFGDPHNLLPPSSRMLVEEHATAEKNRNTETATAVDASTVEVSRPPDASQCPQGCTALLMIGDNGVPVCTMCGTFVSSLSLDHGPDWKTVGADSSHDTRGKDIHRCGNAVNPTMIESSFAYRLSPAMGGGTAGGRNASKWFSWFGCGQSEKSIADELQLLRRVAIVARLPRTVVSTAEQLLHRLRNHPASRGLTKTMRRIRNIWLACQAHGCPRTVPEMAALFRVPLPLATRSCALNFEDVMETLEKPLSGQSQLYLGPMLPGQFIHRFGHRLGLSGIAVEIAMYVATIVARYDIAPGNRAHVVAAAALYYSSVCCGVPQTKKNTWMMLDREISAVGIHRAYTKLCFYRIFPAELRDTYPNATLAENKCLKMQGLLPLVAQQEEGVLATTTITITA